MGERNSLFLSFLSLSLSVALLSLATITTGGLLASSHVSADNPSVVDEINITVPIACTMSGTGMQSHNAEIANGTYTPDIGSTILHAFCNDNEGFAIYAAGYTGNEVGGTNSNKLVGTTASGNATIESGIATSSGNPDISNWAMKLAISQDSGDTTGTNVFTIDSAPNVDLPSEAEQSATPVSFTQYHVVPNEYTKVAHKNSNTDMTESTGGVKLTTTYAAYISKTQAADIYSGQVIYTLVHPSSVGSNAVQDAITVIFDGNGLMFPNGQPTNTVKYAKVRNMNGYGYVGSAVGGISKSPNVNNDGEKTVSIATGDSSSESVTIPGADKLKVVIKYDIGPKNTTSGNAYGVVNVSDSYNLYSDLYGKGTETIIAEGDTVYFWYNIWGDVDEEHDYGYYAQVYPVYNTEQSNTTREKLPGDYSLKPIVGSYSETAEWHDKWLTKIDGNDYDFSADPQCENDWCIEDNTPRGALLGYLGYNYDELKGKTITVQSYNPVTFDEAYAAANKVKINGYYAIHDLNAEICGTVSDEEISTVVDVRDGNLYEIAKLRNGDCWMRDDLRLDPTDSTVAANMSATNTNAPSDAIYNYLHGGNVDDNPGWSSVAVIEDKNNPSFTEPKIDKSELSSLIGIKYNYCAASVGTYCLNNGDQSLGDIGYDLCPLNWSDSISSNVSSYSYYGQILSLKVNGLTYWRGEPSGIYPWIIRAQDVNTWYPNLSVISTAGMRSNLHLMRCVIHSS